MTELQDALKFARLRPDLFSCQEFDKRQKRQANHRAVTCPSQNTCVSVCLGGEGRGGEGGACKTVKARSIKE